MGREEFRSPARPLSRPRPRSTQGMVPQKHLDIPLSPARVAGLHSFISSVVPDQVRIGAVLQVELGQYCRSLIEKALSPESCARSHSTRCQDRHFNLYLGLDLGLGPRVRLPLEG